MVPFERKLIVALKRDLPWPLKGKKILLAVSGGADSMALLKFFGRVRGYFNLEIDVVHVHHGKAHSEQQDRFRDQASHFVKVACEKMGLRFVELRNFGHALVGEKACRDFRRRMFKERLIKTSFDVVVFGHHSDDLLETRLLRLLRGVGPGGIKSMSILSEIWLRPFLIFSREEVRQYLGEGPFVEDPSNSDAQFFRNWIRKNWLQPLKDFKPGASASLMRSLENLSNTAAQPFVAEDCITTKGLDRKKLMLTDARIRPQIVQNYFRFVGLEDYTAQHLREVLKRLDTPKKEFTFNLKGFIWKVDAKRAFAQRAISSSP